MGGDSTTPAFGHTSSSIIIQSCGGMWGEGGILLTRAYLLQSDGTTSYTFRKTPLVLPSVRIPGVYPARVLSLTL